LNKETNMLRIEKEKGPRTLSNHRHRHRHFVGWPGHAGSIDNPRIDQSRWYDPSVGRWLSEDPSGLTAGPNPYEYVGNAPTDGTDPSGLGDDIGVLQDATGRPPGGLAPSDAYQPAPAPAAPAPAAPAPAATPASGSKSPLELPPIANSDLPLAAQLFPPVKTIVPAAVFDPAKYTFLPWTVTFQIQGDKAGCQPNGFLIQQVRVSYELQIFDSRRKRIAFFASSAEHKDEDFAFDPRPSYITHNPNLAQSYTYWEMWDVVDGKVKLGQPTNKSAPRLPPEKTLIDRLEDTFDLPWVPFLGQLPKGGRLILHTVMTGNVRWNSLAEKDKDFSPWIVDTDRPGHSLYYSSRNPGRAWSFGVSVFSRKLSLDLDVEQDAEGNIKSNQDRVFQQWSPKGKDN
jgi:RHS repeat-associated protein